MKIPGGRQLLLLVYESPFLELEVEELLQGVGALAVIALGWVVFAAVGDDALQISNEQLFCDVVAILEALRHRLEVCRKEDHGRRKTDVSVET